MTDVIDGCLKNDRNAQHKLYEKYASTMLGICLRYAHSKEEAEDVMMEGFMTVFTKLNTFRGESSLETWIRHIMINTAINHYRSNKKYLLNDSIEDQQENTLTGPIDGEDIQTKLEAKQILEIIEKMPDDFKIIFNLRAIEEYSFKEIGEQLNKKENTVRVYFQRARFWLQNRIQTEEFERKKK